MVDWIRNFTRTTSSSHSPFENGSWAALALEVSRGSAFPTAYPRIPKNWPTLVVFWDPEIWPFCPFWFVWAFTNENTLEPLEGQGPYNSKPAKDSWAEMLRPWKHSTLFRSNCQDAPSNASRSWRRHPHWLWCHLFETTEKWVLPRMQWDEDLRSSYRCFMMFLDQTSPKWEEKWNKHLPND